MSQKLRIWKNTRAILSLVLQNNNDKCVTYLIESVLVPVAILKVCFFFWLICKLWSFSLSCMVSTAVGCPEKKVSVTLKMNKKIISPGVHWYLWFFLMRSIRSDALVTFNCKTNSLPNPFYCNGIQMNFARLHELVQW